MSSPKQPFGRPHDGSAGHLTAGSLFLRQAGQAMVCSALRGAMVRVGAAPQPMSSEYGRPTYQSKPRSRGEWPLAIPRCHSARAHGVSGGSGEGGSESQWGGALPIMPVR